MVDIMIGLAATLAFFNLDWNIAGCLMGIATVADLWLTTSIVTQEGTE